MSPHTQRQPRWRSPAALLAGVLAMFTWLPADAGAGAQIGLALPSGQEMQLLQYPADGRELLIWVPGKRGIRPGNRQFAAIVQREGIDYWLLDLHNAYRVPTGRQGYAAFEPSGIKEVITHAAAQGWTRIVIGGESRGAALAMQAARQWQLDNPGNTALRGLLLFHPYVIQGKPRIGTAAELLPIAASTNLPTYVVQPQLNTKHLLSRQLLEQLETGGAPVYMHTLADVRGGFHLRDPDLLRPAEVAARNKLGTMTRFAFDRLLELPLPTAAAAVPKRESRTRSPQGEHGDDGDLLVRIDATGSPALSLRDGDDRPVTLADGGDAVIMVNFWATWCAPCVQEIASLVRLGDHFEGRPLRVLAVNIGETPGQVREFFHLRDIEPNFDVLFDRDGQAARDWRVYAIPSTYLLDRDRDIRYGYRGALRWDHPEVIEIVQRLIEAPEGSTAE